jgi:hypothetical protein
MLTRWTATAEGVSRSTPSAGRPVAMSGDAHTPISPATIQHTTCLRMTRILNPVARMVPVRAKRFLPGLIASVAAQVM